jgi:hypothetical protein
MNCYTGLRTSRDFLERDLSNEKRAWNFQSEMSRASVQEVDWTQQQGIVLSYIYSDCRRLKEIRLVWGALNRLMRLCICGSESTFIIVYCILYFLGILNILSKLWSGSQPTRRQNKCVCVVSSPRTREDRTRTEEPDRFQWSQGLDEQYWGRTACSARLLLRHQALTILTTQYCCIQFPGAVC